MVWEIHTRGFDSSWRHFFWRIMCEVGIKVPLDKILKRKKKKIFLMISLVHPCSIRKWCLFHMFFPEKNHEYHEWSFEKCKMHKNEWRGAPFFWLIKQNSNQSKTGASLRLLWYSSHKNVYLVWILISFLEDDVTKATNWRSRSSIVQ